MRESNKQTRPFLLHLQTTMGTRQQTSTLHLVTPPKLAARAIWQWAGEDRLKVYEAQASCLAPKANALDMAAPLNPTEQRNEDKAVLELVFRSYSDFRHWLGCGVAIVVAWTKSLVTFCGRASPEEVSGTCTGKPQPIL